MAAEAQRIHAGTMPGKLKFTRMRTDHLDRVMVIERSSFPNPWSEESFSYEIEENEFAIYVVAMVDNLVVAYGGIWVVLDDGHITNIAVHPEYRGMGVGKTLLVYLLATVAGLGVSRVYLEVRVSNIVARNLYSSLGFKESGLRRKYYSDNREDAIVMLKNDLGRQKE